MKLRTIGCSTARSGRWAQAAAGATIEAASAAGAASAARIAVFIVLSSAEACSFQTNCGIVTAPGARDGAKSCNPTEF